MTGQGWFVDVDPGDAAAMGEAVRAGSADAPDDWPARAVDAGFAADDDEYYELLHDATLAGTRAAVREREAADDKQLIHAVRAVADLTESANELAERGTEWAGSVFPDVGGGMDGARDVAAREPENATEERAVAVCQRAVDLVDERDAVREYVQKQGPTVAPNLSKLAGPMLAARLIALAGGLEALAKMPSGTVQVLGAEDALFAHLRGHAPSPKHGAIFTHEYVRNTHPDNRGSAARALAGKLTIAARIDHYSGDLRPELEAELDERIERIRARDTE